MISAEANERDIQQIIEKFERLGFKLRRPIAANRQASIAMYGATIRNFDQQGEMFGKWPPLKERTIKEKIRIGKEQPLVRTGHLRNAFVPFYSGEYAGMRNDARYRFDAGQKSNRPVEETAYASQNAVEYAQAHHEGVPSRNLPARNLLPDRRSVLEIGIKVYGRYVQDEVRKAS